MPSVLSKPAGISKAHPKASFFAPRLGLRPYAPLDYTNIQRNEVNPQNPPRASVTGTTSTFTTDLDGDTIMVASPGDPDYDSDHEIIDTPQPTFANTQMTEAEKIEAIKKWAINKEKHTRKKRDKASHVYYYMKREAVDGVFYSEYLNGPKIF